MAFIASRLTGAQNYTIYDSSNNPVKSILINGGHGLTNRHLEVLDGAVTQVTDEELELLLKHPVFIRHKENGFVSIVGSESETKKAISDLQPRDEAAPMTQNDVDKLMEDNNLDVTLDFDDPTATKKRKRAVE